VVFTVEANTQKLLATERYYTGFEGGTTETINRPNAYFKKAKEISD
jgi:hypothetical protein